jgi:AbrB family looped-hinge helix DNA binding protein
MANGNNGHLRVGAQGAIAIPAHLLRAINLNEGDPVGIEMTEDGILLRTSTGRDPSQWWFWTEEWQAGEREVDENIRAGRLCGPMTDEEFLASLEADLDLD